MGSRQNRSPRPFDIGGHREDWIQRPETASANSIGSVHRRVRLYIVALTMLTGAVGVNRIRIIKHNPFIIRTNIISQFCRGEGILRPASLEYDHLIATIETRSISMLRQLLFKQSACHSIMDKAAASFGRWWRQNKLPHSKSTDCNLLSREPALRSLRTTTQRKSYTWRHKSAYRAARVSKRAQFVWRSGRSLTVAALYADYQLHWCYFLWP
jgi:hypothetical protein